MNVWNKTQQISKSNNFKMPKLSFPPLRIVEEKMTNKEILETFNTAFGGEAVAKVVKQEQSYHSY